MTPVLEMTQLQSHSSKAGEHSSKAGEHSHLNMSPCHQSSSVLSLKAAVHEQCVSTNVVSKSSTSSGQHAPCIQTAPTLSKSLPVCSMWIIPGLPPKQAKSRQMISPVVCQKRKDSPVSGDCCTTVSYSPALRMLRMLK